MAATVCRVMDCGRVRDDVLGGFFAARLAEARILGAAPAPTVATECFECGDMMDAFTESALEQPAADLAATPCGLGVR